MLLQNVSKMMARLSPASFSRAVWLIQLRIFGRPCIVTDACSALSSLGDIILADLSQYLIGMRAEAVI